MKKCQFCGKEILDSADFCPFCMSSLKEKTPISFKQKGILIKKWIIPCIALILVLTVTVLAVGNIKPKGNSNFVLLSVSGNNDENTLSEPSLNGDNSDSGNTPTPDNTTSSTPSTPQAPSGGGTTDNDNGDDNSKGENTFGDDNQTPDNSGGDAGGNGGGTTVTPNDDIVKYLKYTINDSDTAPYKYVAITGCDENLVGDVVVPSTIDGYPVTELYYGAFRKCSKITSMVIPDSVTSIASMVFNSCTSLVEIKLPAKSTIGFAAFGECTSLKRVTLPVMDEVPAAVFHDCTALEYVEINSGIVRNSAFDGCTNLKTVKFAKSLTITLICLNAFGGCSSLTDVYYSKGLEAIPFEDGYSDHYFLNATFHKDY